MRLTIGSVVIGGTSLEYKTGRWRDQRPVVDEASCKACGQCEMVCPDDAVREVDGKYTIDLEYCKGCGLCSFECPTKSIEMVSEEK